MHEAHEPISPAKVRLFLQNAKQIAEKCAIWKFSIWKFIQARASDKVERQIRLNGATSHISAIVGAEQRVRSKQRIRGSVGGDASQRRNST